MIHADAGQAAAKIRVKLALDSIEEAQLLLDQTRRALATVQGMAPHSRSVASVSRRLTRTWFAICADAHYLLFSPDLESRDRE